MTRATGQSFWKMSGSGNDFVFFDARATPHSELRCAVALRRLCDRRRGIGADGVVFLESASDPELSFRMVYFNSDGSRASMCGNAALCCTGLATTIGLAAPEGFAFESDAGRVAARVNDGVPEVDLPAVRGLTADAAIEPEAGERRIGYAVVGVPHLVVLCDDVAQVPLGRRGPALRRHAAVGNDGANANFVSALGDGAWRMRTFERGVEAETLACGTGAAACAAVLSSWDAAARDGANLVTASECVLSVRFGGGAGSVPSLRGEGRVVFAGELCEL